MAIKATSQVYKNYKILKRIGEGGFSEVYKVELANDPSPIKTVYALKYFIIKNENERESTLNRFKQEIDIMKRVNSKYFPKYIDSYFNDEEQYVVMEYVDGINLKDHVKRNGKLIPREAVLITEQICEAIHELHSCGIIHRDIKSNNIIVTKENEIKILDFGLSLAEDSQRFTQATKVVGSVYYMAPELCKTNNAPSVRSDIYALGILLFELLTGRYPIAGKEAVETLKKQITVPIPRLTNFIQAPQPLENVIIKATAKDPYKRYGSAWEMKMDLKSVFDPKRIYEKPLNVKNIKTKKSFSDVINNKKFLISSIVVVIVIVIAAVLGIFFGIKK